jgi:hypothetical protein
MKRIGPTLAGLLCALALGATASLAHAQQLTCDIHSIRASASGADISAPLDAYRDHLLRPPLSSFTAFELIGTHTVTLRLGAAEDLRLAHGIAGRLELTAVEGAQRIFELSLRHERRTLLNSRIAMTPGRPFFVVVGSVIPEGTLVLGIVCR